MLRQLTDSEIHKHGSENGAGRYHQHIQRKRELSA